MLTAHLDVLSRIGSLCSLKSSSQLQTSLNAIRRYSIYSKNSNSYSFLGFCSRSGSISAKDSSERLPLVRSLCSFLSSRPSSLRLEELTSSSRAVGTSPSCEALRENLVVWTRIGLSLPVGETVNGSYLKWTHALSGRFILSKHVLQ